jgi:hypothetical protein
MIITTTQPNKQVSAATMHCAKDSLIEDNDKNEIMMMMMMMQTLARKPLRQSTRHK